MSKGFVLVVEDDPDGQEVINTILQHHHFLVHTAATAESAIELLEQHRYALAVLDLSLPKMDGWKLLQWIKNHPDTTQLPCIAITAYHSADVAAKALAAGFLSYLPKPLEPAAFINEVRAFVR